MFRIYTLFLLDLKLTVRNFFTTILITFLGATCLASFYLLNQIFFVDISYGMGGVYWAVLVLTTWFTLLPPIFRDYRLGLASQFSLAGIDPFEYFVEKMIVAFLRLIFPVAVYSGLIFYLFLEDPRELLPLVFFSLLVTAAVVLVSTWLAGLTAEISLKLFGVLVLPFLLPIMLAAWNLHAPLFGPAMSYPEAWIYWLLSYVVIMFTGLWLSAEFLWEEF